MVPEDKQQIYNSLRLIPDLHHKPSTCPIANSDISLYLECLDRLAPKLAEYNLIQNKLVYKYQQIIYRIELQLKKLESKVPNRTKEQLSEVIKEIEFILR